MALILRGCVQMIPQAAPRPAAISSSRMNCGSCVVLPHPVSPETTTTCDEATAATSSAFLPNAGSFLRNSAMRWTLGVERALSCSRRRRSLRAAVAGDGRPGGSAGAEEPPGSAPQGSAPAADPRRSGPTAGFLAAGSGTALSRCMCPPGRSPLPDGCSAITTICCMWRSMLIVCSCCAARSARKSGSGRLLTTTTVFTPFP
mmetsp:Transcript_9152/g.22062  ORF Transcript_9152/g.22062 Transcript_9152/m.22062 type:complete len:202 (-) Transcript_9152:595-1200(-)